MIKITCDKCSKEVTECYKQQSLTELAFGVTMASDIFSNQVLCKDCYEKEKPGE